MRQRSGAAGSAFGHDDVAVEFFDSPLAQSRLHELEAAGYAGQEIVKVVRKSARELADRFHLLALAEHLFGRHEFTRTLFDALFEFGGKVTQRALGLLLRRNVSVRAEPSHDRAALVVNWHDTRQEGAKITIRGARKHHFEGIAAGNRRCPTFKNVGKNLRIVEFLPIHPSISAGDVPV